MLRDRYGLFTSNRLITDCPLFVTKPRKDDDAREFRKAFQVIVSRGLVWFRCRRAHFCGRKGCPIKNKAVLDIYDLICWLDGKRDLNHARIVVAEYFDVELANFPQSTGSPGKVNETGSKKADWMRYAVPKEALARLFRLPSAGRGAPQRFLAKAVEVITGAPEVPYDGHNSDTGDAILFSRSFSWEIKLKEFGPASRLFVWLHWKQAEAQKKLVITHEEIAKALGITVRTVRDYARMLIKGGYIEVSQGNKPKNSWSAKYRSEG
ncbi:MAG: winged helix-turn-helix transcriptional regulator [Desulfomonile tiedjei]|uniref:Winged helix-turn-helix transcriptional regulator n=1 Tax=Desulfomonile tiedjei TaxID=2358 RepID=A0A9D6V173_9BACT|nr:winged helix-turn-helix transcriptional regulator [Desulfomonile tiedjei]